MLIGLKDDCCVSFTKVGAHEQAETRNSHNGRRKR